MDEKRLEILRMARELVINEHTDRRAELHNQWLVQSEKMWATHRQRVPYPPIPPYPTEDVILARAESLLKFISKADAPEPPKRSQDVPLIVRAKPHAPIEPEPIAKPQPVVAESTPIAPTGPEITQSEPIVPPGPAITGEGESERTAMRDIPKPPPAPPEDAKPEIIVPAVEQAKLAYEQATAKVTRDMGDGSTSVGRLMPAVFKKLDEMRRGINS